MSTNFHHDMPDSLFQITERSAEVAPEDLVYHKLCAASDFQPNEGKPFHIEGTHLAVFNYKDGFYAVDNRCPHMGYPMSEGS
ncbi:MAG: Rieske (2Fe-2S) protein, partial [Candidatus Poribacteria bacterium]|nr:Rieske (2Fe-2S) protein [Candidatus Poribacteria bacterium]